MRPLHTTFAVAASHPTDAHFLIRRGREDRDARGVMCLHGWGTLAKHYIARPVVNGVMSGQWWAYAERGFPVLCPDAAGAATFWNQAAVDAVATVIGWFQNQPGVIDGPVHLVGNSMGGGLAVRVAKQHPELVSSLLLLNPALDGPDIYANVAEAAAAMDAAYGGSWATSLAADPLINPLANATALAATGIPVELYQSSDDPTTEPQFTQALHDALLAVDPDYPVTYHDVGATGHSHIELDTYAMVQDLWARGILA